MKTNTRRIPWIFTLGVILLLAACYVPGISPAATPESPTSPPAMPSQFPTQAAATESVPPTEVAKVPTPSPTSPPPTPTETELPTQEEPPVPPIPTPALGPAIDHFPAGQKINITQIEMIDPLQGWGIGSTNNSNDHVFRTQDGGTKWKDVTPPEPDPGAGVVLHAAAAFRGMSYAWVIYSQDAQAGPSNPALVWYTSDGGNSWNYGMLDLSTIMYQFFIPTHLVFIDNLTGWMLAHVGAGMMHDYITIAATTDGGLTWQFVLEPNSEANILSCSKNGMAFVDAKNGWVSVECNGVYPHPYLYRTSDGGFTWQELNMPAPPATTDFFDNYACGTYYPTLFSKTSAVFAMRCRDIATYKTQQNYLYRTTDGGSNWQVNALPADFTIPDYGGGLYFASEQEGLALSRKIFKTADGGQTWAKVRLVNWDAQFSFLDLNTAWAAAFDPVNYAGKYALVNSTDGLVTLHMLTPVVGP